MKIYWSTSLVRRVCHLWPASVIRHMCHLWPASVIRHMCHLSLSSIFNSIPSSSDDDSEDENHPPPLEVIPFTPPLPRWVRSTQMQQVLLQVTLQINDVHVLSLKEPLPY